jgi:thioredoxin reductase (NADPH)
MRTNVRFIREATALSGDASGFVVNVSGGGPVQGRTVVLTQGVAYRRLGIPQLEALAGAGVYYGAAVTEAPATRDKEVCWRR